MQLPNGERATVDINKLQDYCLNSQHPLGRDKARVFRAALGWTQQHAEQLRSALLEAAANNEAMLGARDDFGQRYTVDFTSGGVRIRSIWMLSAHHDIPHLITCFVQ